jgi:hypothetical protein
MTATNNQVPDHDADAVEALLPWYVNGTLNARDVRRVEQALQQDRTLAARLADIRDDAAETIHLNETLGAPSSRAMRNLFAAIDAEPARHLQTTRGVAVRLGGFLAALSPRALAGVAAAAAVVLVVQAAVLGTVLVGGRGGEFRTASYQAPKAPVGTMGLIRFTPDARISDINDLLDSYHASVVEGPRAGVFRIAIGDKALAPDERARLIARLQSEKIVGFVAAAE